MAMTEKPMREYGVSAERVDGHGSLSFCKEAEILLDTNVDGRLDAFNPAELLPSAAPPAVACKAGDTCHRIP